MARKRKVEEQPVPGYITTNPDGTFDLTIDTENFIKYNKKADKQADKTMKMLKQMVPFLFEPVKEDQPLKKRRKK